MRSLKRLVIFWLTLCVLTYAASAEEGNALAIFNAFLARYAAENIAWRTDVQMRHRCDAPPGLGYLVGKSDLGDFTYRPKLFNELTRPEKRMMLRDPRLGAFIMTLRQAAGDEAQSQQPSVEQLNVSQTAKIAVKSILDALPPGNRSPRDVIHVIEISAQQMLNDGNIVIYLP